ncbi:hypothetical protein D1122_01455 [Cereibacter sphaeroides]|uniref:hypothetical protein n=1 Tax=Cereibacter sphaeroides TaxID=1063 RepID=UPI000E5A59BD|nr:hypothetical protein [Cereibacter sphaeroides]RIA01355.1 hypothetical protein D1122_01455 [Cereibacter sphaeroides]
MNWNDLSLEDLAEIAYTTDVTARIAASAAELLAVEEGRVRVSMVPGKPVAILLPVQLPAVEPEQAGCIWCADTSDEEFIEQLGNTDEEAVEKVLSSQLVALKASRLPAGVSFQPLVPDPVTPAGAPTPVGQEEALRQTAAWLVTPHPEDGEAVDYDAPATVAHDEDAAAAEPASPDPEPQPSCVWCADEVAEPGSDACQDCRERRAELAEAEVPPGPVVCDDADIVAARDAGMKRADLAEKFGRTEPQIQAVLMRAAKRAKETAGQPARSDEHGAITAEDPIEDAVPEPAAPASAEPEVPPEAGGGTMMAPDGIDPDLWAHVQSVQRDRTWTLQRDYDLLGFAELGWPMHEISLELQVPSAELKPRFKVLTASNRWKRAEVLEALRALVPGAQAAE